MSNVDYGEDFLQRIVGVHWRKGGEGGAVFIYAEQEGNNLHYVKFRNSEDRNPETRTIALPEPPLLPQDVSGDRFKASGSSYAMAGTITIADTKPGPAFLLCGRRTTIGSGGLTDYHSLIYRSVNGLDWRQVRQEDATNLPASGGEHFSLASNALVWDPKIKSFFYDQTYSHAHPDLITFDVLDQIFQSSDGRSWSMISSTPTSFDSSTGGSGDNRWPSLFLDHCAHNDCLDQYDHHVPDGAMWQDPAIAANGKSKIVTRPLFPQTVEYGSGGCFTVSGNNAIEVVRNDILESATVSIPGIGNVVCVAGAAGVLMAGGYQGTRENYEDPGAVAFSLDDGKSWKPLASTPIGVVTMVAASI